MMFYVTHLLQSREASDAGAGLVSDELNMNISMYICIHICIKLGNHINSIIIKMYTSENHVDFLCI